MSRSYKKTVGWCDSQPVIKRKFNRAFRRNTFDFPSGKAYKKKYNSYDIADWKWLEFGDRTSIVMQLMQRQSRWRAPMAKREAEQEYIKMRSK